MPYYKSTKARLPQGLTSRELESRGAGWSLFINSNLPSPITEETEFDLSPALLPLFDDSTPYSPGQPRAWVLTPSVDLMHFPNPFALDCIKGIDDILALRSSMPVSEEGWEVQKLGVEEMYLRGGCGEHFEDDSYYADDEMQDTGEEEEEWNEVCRELRDIQLQEMQVGHDQYSIEQINTNEEHRYYGLNRVQKLNYHLPFPLVTTLPLHDSRCSPYRGVPQLNEQANSFRAACFIDLSNQRKVLISDADVDRFDFMHDFGFSGLSRRLWRAERDANNYLIFLLNEEQESRLKDMMPQDHDLELRQIESFNHLAATRELLVGQLHDYQEESEDRKDLQKAIDSFDVDNNFTSIDLLQSATNARQRGFETLGMIISQASETRIQEIINLRQATAEPVLPDYEDFEAIEEAVHRWELHCFSCLVMRREEYRAKLEDDRSHVEFCHGWEYENKMYESALFDLAKEAHASGNSDLVALILSTQESNYARFGSLKPKWWEWEWNSNTSIASLEARYRRQEREDLESLVLQRELMRSALAENLTTIEQQRILSNIAQFEREHALDQLSMYTRLEVAQEKGDFEMRELVEAIRYFESHSRH